MRIAVFGAKNYERRLLDELNPRHKHEIVYFEPLLGPDTAVLAAGFPAVAVFVNDQVDADVIKQLAAGGTKLVTTRSTGYNQIDLAAAKRSSIKVTRVTNYSPNSVAEHAVALVLQRAARAAFPGRSPFPRHRFPGRRSSRGRCRATRRCFTVTDRR